MKDPRPKLNREHFLQVCLMVLLKEKSNYGYQLLEDLEPFGIDSESLNIGALYRSLRKLENEGYIESDWIDSDQGPQKRIYHLTDLGKTNLNDRMTFIHHRRQSLENLIHQYEKGDLK